MATRVFINPYEDWGVGTGTPVRGTNRTGITNANLKTVSDPAVNYALASLRRPKTAWNNKLFTITHKRHIFWQISGTYGTIKDIKITLPAPTGSAFKMFYSITNIYSQSVTNLDEFNKSNGTFDGTLIPLTEEVTLHPHISTLGPEHAVSRAISWGPNQTVYTNYLVLQAMALQSTYNDVGPDFGVEKITFSFVELE